MEVERFKPLITQLSFAICSLHIWVLNYAWCNNPNGLTCHRVRENQATKCSFPKGLALKRTVGNASPSQLHMAKSKPLSGCACCFEYKNHDHLKHALLTNTTSLLGFLHGQVGSSTQPTVTE
jgi:hypothetical protein